MSVSFPKSGTGWGDVTATNTKKKPYSTRMSERALFITSPYLL